MQEIRRATRHDAKNVAEMVNHLLMEISKAPYNQEVYYNVALELLETANNYAVFLAFNRENICIGMISVMESCSIYAGGRFGIIQELYVLPEYRSAQVGHQLIEGVKVHAREKKWNRLEVGAPELPKWERTVAFYRQEGFQERGPRLSIKFHS